MQFQATLLQLAEPHPHSNRKISLEWIYTFHAILSFIALPARKAPPRKNFFRLNLSISCNFKQLDLSWQKSPSHQEQGIFFRLDLSISCNFRQFAPVGRKAPPPQQENFFKTGFVHFMQFWATLLQLVEMPPPPPPGTGKIIWHWIYPFHTILSNFASAGRQAHPPKQGNFFRLDVSISCNFKQICFSWQ